MSSKRKSCRNGKSGNFSIASSGNTILLAIILLITFFSFFIILWADFLAYDDDILIVKNELIRKLDFSLVSNSFRFDKIVHYHPLVYLSYALEYKVFKLVPFWYHLTNLMLHLVNVVLVYFFIKKINPSKFVYFFTALLFAIHPLHVESVAWATERKDLLYSLFFTASLLFYIMYVKQRDRKLYYTSLLLFVFSCLSKSMAVTLPLVIFLLDYKITGKIKNNYLEKIPYIFVSVIFIIINLNVTYYKTDLDNYSIYERISLISYSILFYPFKMIIPLNLSAIYLYPDSLELIHLGTPFIFILLLLLIFKIKKSSNVFRFGVLFYLFTILPVLPILPFGISITADRFSYIPLLGFFYIFSVYLNDIYLKMSSYEYVRGIAAGFFVILTLSLSYITFNRCKIWIDTETLMNDVLQKNDKNYWAYYILGNYYSDKQLYNKAVDCYITSIDIKANYSDAYFSLGNAYFNMGNFNESIKYYQKDIEINPLDKEAYNNLGVAYENLGQLQKAINNYQISARLGYTPAMDVLKYYGYSW